MPYTIFAYDRAFGSLVDYRFKILCLTDHVKVRLSIHCCNLMFVHCTSYAPHIMLTCVTPGSLLAAGSHSLLHVV